MVSIALNLNSNILISKVSLSIRSNIYNNPSIDIAFAIDNNYAAPCGISIYSIIKNNPNLKINFHIFTPDLLDTKKFKSLINDNINIYIYLLNTKSLQHLQTTKNFPTSIYYRLVIPLILKDNLSKIIYLDADILCVGDISSLNLINIEEYIAGAVKDSSIKKEDITSIGLPKNYNYFNSGVLLINIPAWIDNLVTDKALELIINRSFIYPDQDALNITLRNKVLYLDEKYNYFSKKCINPVFIHYVSNPKPWNVSASNNENYLAYYKQSPWKNIPLTPPRNYREMKKYSFKLWKQRKYIASIKWFILYSLKKFIME